MEHLGYSDMIRKIITDIPEGQPFQTEMIARELAAQNHVPLRQAKLIANTILKRLVDKGHLERFQKGTYYRTKQTAFGKIRPSASMLEVQLLMLRNEEIIGYETGISLMNQIGLTTLVPRQRDIATNAYRKKINDIHIRVKKPVIAVNGNNYRYLQLLDAIRDMPNAPIDAVNPKGLLRSFVQKNALDPVKALSFAKQHYPQRTLLNLVDLLVEGKAI